METVYELYLAVSRWVLPCLALLLALFWYFYYRSFTKNQRVLARLVTKDDIPLNITCGEGYIGRHRKCDVQLPIPTVSKKHAAFFYQEGDWFITPLDGELFIDGKEISGPTRLQPDDCVDFAGEELFFEPADGESLDISSDSSPTGGLPLLLLSFFQVIMAGQLALRFTDTMPFRILMGFGILLVGEWVYFAVTRLKKDFAMLAELPVLFLLTLGLAVCISSNPSALPKQLVCAGVGVAGYIVLSLLLQRRALCHRLKWPVAGLTVAVLFFTALFGTSINGSRNWLSIAGYSFQPSEFAKVAFIFVGACSLYVIIQKPLNRLLFLAFAALVMGSLVIMIDFGTLAIFFVTLILILMMQQTDWKIIALILVGAVGAGLLVIWLYPHILGRFNAWLHVWDYASTIGYQQTRTLIASASGGLLGVGGGNGTLLSVTAADTDLVFGVVSEEWGAVIALCCALCFVALGIYARRLARTTHSVFCAIGVCAVAVMLLFQTALNLFGSTDFLPLTGVTMPFVSCGGTSLIACFWLMAFFKGAESQPKVLHDERGALH